MIQQRDIGELECVILRSPDASPEPVTLSQLVSERTPPKATDEERKRARLNLLMPTLFASPAGG